MTMSKKAGKRTKKLKKRSQKKEKKNLPVLPIWNDETINLVLNNALEGIVIIGDDLILEYVNEAGSKLFGGSPSELIGHGFNEFMIDDIARFVIERYEKRRKGEDVPDSYSFDVIRKDGEKRTLEGCFELFIGPDGKQKTLAIVLDSTQIIENQKALEESKTRYKLLVETMKDGLAIDNEEGELTYVNDAFCRMLGCSPGELIGKHWSDLTDEMTPDDVKGKIRERKSGVSESYELTWCHKNGTTVPTIVSATPYIDYDGRFAGTFAVITEITDQKEAEESIQFYLDLLSHDIANQLQVIMTSSGLLEQEVPASYIEDARQDILDAVDRCNRLITKVKRAGQIRRIPVTSVDLVDIIDEKTAVLERVYSAKIHRTGLKKTVMVDADVLLGELVWNLLENSARHNPTDNKEVWISVKTKGNSVLLSIGDNGPGLSNARKKNLFTERSHAGGVGLKLVRQMIRKYGGSIEVDDRVKGKPNEGANFTVTLQKTKKTK
ncbi:MAG: PAS domain-containing sensor histidine kinase [Candidatus Thorarchaeota archaeon]